MPPHGTLHTQAWRGVGGPGTYSIREQSEFVNARRYKTFGKPVEILVSNLISSRHTSAETHYSTYKSLFLFSMCIIAGSACVRQDIMLS